MIILQLLRDPVTMVMFLLFIVVSLTVHEYAHARTAFALGDYTAYAAGRLTLDPRKHLDPVGALMFLLVGFGYAKPVPVDVGRIGRDGMLKVAAAGPISNLLMAGTAGLIWRLGVVPTFLQNAAVLFILMNISLAVFNMLPIAPLDGSRVLMGLVPLDMAYQVARFEQYGFMILFGLIMLGRVANIDLLGLLMDPPINFLFHLFTGAAS